MRKLAKTPTQVNSGAVGGGSVVRFPSVSGAFRTNETTWSLLRDWMPDTGATPGR